MLKIQNKDTTPLNMLIKKGPGYKVEFDFMLDTIDKIITTM